MRIPRAANARRRRPSSDPQPFLKKEKEERQLLLQVGGVDAEVIYEASKSCF